MVDRHVKLKLESINRTYAQGAGELRILQGADLEILSGEIVALVAPSGAGKSTLLHVSGLLERADSGSVTICDVPTDDLSDRERTLVRRQHVGYIYQFHHLLPEFNATENVMMPQLIAGQADRVAKARGEELLSMMGLKDRGTHRPAQLSGGEQQRVAIARALANSPGLILADEPTGNLDPETSSVVFDLLADSIRNHDAAGLIATHNHDIAKMADRVLTLKDGKLVPFTF
ncbi:ABC transporter ATP-binding protein [Maritalea porphyrae]|uniref:Lipoprotein-releasing system ATP-binding protein LolD n=1 Tax=Maritalea porphyrae TaxID=880732 RepID=A0ABQ5UVT0_9HYPH|nr:ABC transporter ATP-binding protein [Maritalea porphyrae]GLQ18501.1 lipoprotein-releasing system ATP-binding protein LolD [Maritalea porphyrae]